MCADVRALVARVWKHSLGRPVRALVALCAHAAQAVLGACEAWYWRPGFASLILLDRGCEALGFASDMAKPVETLKNMNVQTAKHASWVVRVLSPKIIPYTFNSKGQQVAAEKFVCLLVSKDPKQFMFGSVPFSFANKKAARQAFERFQDGACFRVQQPEFDSKFKTEFMSTSIKRALLLTKPTELQAIAIADAETLKDIACYVDLGLSLTQVMDRLKSIAWQAAQTLSGPARQVQLLNVTGKVQSLLPLKQVTVAGRTRNVASVELVDQEGCVVELSVWDEAYNQVSPLSLGQGITIVGCSAQRDGEQVKLSLWEAAHVLTGGPIAQSLTRWDPQGAERKKLTAVFSASGPLLPVESIAVPTCAAALANAPKLTSERVFQINRCIIDVPTREDQMFTQDGKRLYSNCRLRDWSGSVDVDLVSEAMLQMYGLSSHEEVVQALADQSLTVNLSRFNARGVLRPTLLSGMKALIGLVQESPLDAVVSAKAMRDMLGLATVTGDIVLPAPATCVHDFGGLALETSEKTYISAHRVLLLVKGTTPSKLDSFGEQSQPLAAQSFRISSIKTQCLLSDTEVFVNLYGYCAFNNMLQYRLDKDTALVLASAVDIDPVTQEKTFTVEHITKVQDVDNLKKSLETEWRTVLEHVVPKESEQYSSPQKVEYWDRDAKRLKRIISEA